jgi:Flp pilus assembly protein TadD
MTLNITVVTARIIYQCADYRFTDTSSGATHDFPSNQKIFTVNRRRWHATVCFNGVGTSTSVHVSNWLAERIANLKQDDPFDRMIEELLRADDWLSSIRPPHNRHTFSIGAFQGEQPVFTLVSNYEKPFGVVLRDAMPNLSVHQERPSKPMTYVSGQPQTVDRPTRRRLATLATQTKDAGVVFSELAKANRAAARKSKFVSKSCYTTYINRTGEGGGSPHEIAIPAGSPGTDLGTELGLQNAAMEDAIKQLLREISGGASLRGTSFARSEATDDFHRIQLLDKPNDPNVHCNYGAYLEGKKGDMQGAERAYRKALELDARHVNSLGNLANVYWNRGDTQKASEFYQSALAVEPGNENVSWNYGSFLSRRRDLEQARKVVQEGLSKNPRSARLVLLLAQIDLHLNRIAEALEGFQRAREAGAEQAAVEAGFAFAKHVGGSSNLDCISAYRTAIALDPQNAALLLNLAQLLFIEDQDEEANRLLRQALRQGLDQDAELEAQFYILAHTRYDHKGSLSRIGTLITDGARLRWQVDPNIEHVQRQDPKGVSS